MIYEKLKQNLKKLKLWTEYSADLKEIKMTHHLTASDLLCEPLYACHISISYSIILQVLYPKFEEV